MISLAQKYFFYSARKGKLEKDELQNAMRERKYCELTVQTIVSWLVTLRATLMV